MGLRAVEEGFFTVPSAPFERPALLGSRCPSCGEYFFPRRQVCARCLTEGCGDVLLASSGRLWTWTYVHLPQFATSDRSVAGYGVGQIDLPEGPRVQSVLLGEPAAFRIGMEVELDLETLETDEDGDDVVIFRFRPRR